MGLPKVWYPQKLFFDPPRGHFAKGLPKWAPWAPNPVPKRVKGRSSFKLVDINHY